ncbi:MAG: hypothetical protein U0324_07765 [Polyangiales bacterium]
MNLRVPHRNEASVRFESLVVGVVLAACAPASPAPDDARAEAGIDAPAVDQPPADDGAIDARSAADWVPVPDTGACARTDRCGGGVCVGGRCLCPFTLCGDRCVNTGYDPSSCGRCDHRCAATAPSCVEGTCVCSGEICDGVCVPVSSDPLHCGRCDRRCAAPTTVCRDGVCTCPKDQCGGACVDVRTDPAHCGACGRACGAHQRCEGGACVCEADYGQCDGAAQCETALRDNPSHCGGCDEVCYAGERCDATRCVATACAPGLADCEAPETPCETRTDSSDRHCGACGRACAAGTRCAGGRCVSAAVTMHMPGSTLAATSARPWFRWALGADIDGARLQVCRDLACAALTLDVDVTGDRYRPTEALAPGIHFWRVFPRRRGVTDATSGPVWWFVVPGADPLVRGLDLNGDGATDTAVLERAPRRAFVIRVQYGAGPDGVRPPDRVIAAPMGERSIVSRASALSAAGDVNGDGVGDAIVTVEEYLPPSGGSAGALKTVGLLLGSRSGTPFLRSVFQDVTYGFPGPVIHDLIVRGNAPDTPGVTVTFGAFGHCGWYHFGADGRLVEAPASSCPDGRHAVGDYDADGRNELVLSDDPAIPRFREVSACAGLPDLRTEWDHTLATRDVDGDGYDDLTIEVRSTATRYALFGGPRGLDGSRCSRAP